MTRDLATEGAVPGQQRMDVGALRHLELCAGYGGLGLALERAFGAETVAVSDIDPGACKILAHRYPHVPNLGDMTSVDWSEWVGKVDVISGGTPCQDLSSAGRRRGMTDGTRSNLWVAMRDAIATIKPTLVVWENVRGAFSATADSDLEPCAGCVGDPPREPVLRALGRVLGDLSSLGYDAWWYGLRASDVGAAHHRFRVFVFAIRQPSVLDAGHRTRCAECGHELGSDDGTRESGEGVADADERGREWWLRAIERHAHRPGGAHGLRGAGEPAPLVAIPTPTAERDGNTPETHLARKPGRKVVTSLDVVVNHCLPSPRTSDTNGPGAHGTGGPDLRTVVSMMPTPTASLAEHRRDSGTDPERRRAQGRTISTADVVCHALPTPRATDGTKGGPNQRGLSGDVMLPSATASLPTPRATRGGSSTETAELAASQDWREYEPAIRRQEAAFGYPAPMPTEPNKNGNPRLSATFSEWLMGLPPGWITDVPGITRNEALKAAGNGVVPQQCEAAARRFLADYTAQVAA